MRCRRALQFRWLSHCPFPRFYRRVKEAWGRESQHVKMDGAKSLSTNTLAAVARQ
jgi:hypothetical protein